MTDLPAPSENRWRLWSTVGVVLAILIGAGLGIVVIPLVQGAGGGVDPYTAICRALGILPGSPARPTPSFEAAAVPVTRVAWTDSTISEIYGADRDAGAKLAEQRCIACHTVEGNTPDPTIPRNAGQSRFAIYKQLHDYKSGARRNDTMTPMVADLDDKGIADLAAYYGRLVRGAIDPERSGVFVGADIENIVLNGDIARDLPPCSACHGIRAGGPIETPTLTSQYAQYIEAQLKAFGNGQRHNDIYHRMRSVASKLTPSEMQLLGVYYSGK
jgi:cytochrome c553